MNNQPDLDPEDLWRQYQLNISEAIQLANEHDLSEAIPRANELCDEIRQLTNSISDTIRGNEQNLIDDRQQELDKMVAEINLSIMVKALIKGIACHPFFFISTGDDWDPDVIFDLYDESLGRRPMEIPCSELKNQILQILSNGQVL
ncbi:MAG: hypothetical protein ACRCZI_07450 [Cetobacterium sp.]